MKQRNRLIASVFSLLFLIQGVLANMLALKYSGLADISLKTCSDFWINKPVLEIYSDFWAFSIVGMWFGVLGFLIIFFIDLREYDNKEETE